MRGCDFLKLLISYIETNHRLREQCVYNTNPDLSVCFPFLTSHLSLHHDTLFIQLQWELSQIKILSEDEPNQTKKLPPKGTSKDGFFFFFLVQVDMQLIGTAKWLTVTGECCGRNTETKLSQRSVKEERQ